MILTITFDLHRPDIAQIQVQNRVSRPSRAPDEVTRLGVTHKTSPDLPWWCTCFAG